MDSFASPYMDRQDSEDLSHSKKSKKKKKKSEKDGDQHKHKKSKHKKERRHSSSRHESRSINVGGLYDQAAGGSSGGQRSISDQLKSVFIPNISANLQDSLGGTLHAYNHQFKDPQQVVLNSPPGTCVPTYSNYVTLVPSNTSSPLTISALPLDGQLVTLDGQYNQLDNISPQIPGQTTLTNPLYITNQPGNLKLNLAPGIVNINPSTPPMSPGNFIGLTQVPTHVAPLVNTNHKPSSKKYRNGHDVYDSHQESKNHYHQKYETDKHSMHSVKHKANESLQVPTSSQDSNSRHDIPDYNRYQPSQQTHERQREKYEDRYSRSRKSERRDSERCDTERQDSDRHGTKRHDNDRHESERHNPKQNMYDGKYNIPPSSQSSHSHLPQSQIQDSHHQNDPARNYHNQQQSHPSFPSQPGIRPPFNQQQNLQSNTFNQHQPQHHAGGKFQPPSQGFVPDGPRPDFSKPPPSFNQPPLDFSKKNQANFNQPPQNFQRPPVDFSKPPPGFSGPPDFSKQQSGFSGQPVDFSKGPPADFSQPTPNFSKPPQDFSNPPSNITGLPLADFSKPPPDFSKPPPGFTVPPPNFSNVAPDFSKPPPNFQNQGPPPRFGQIPGERHPSHIPPFHGQSNIRPPHHFGQERFPHPADSSVQKPPPGHLPPSSSNQMQHGRSIPQKSTNQHSEYNKGKDSNNYPPFQHDLKISQQNQSMHDHAHERIHHSESNDQWKNLESDRRHHMYTDRNQSQKHHSANNAGLGTDDYSKIAQALETIQSHSYDNTDEGSQHGGSQHEKESREKEKKSKKHKKQKKKEKKKEKEKEIKKRLEEKLAELASLNDEDQQISEKPPSSLSIQLKPQQSKFNLKIGSPLMRGNIFQKYKEKKESPLFTGKEHADRKYRKITEAGLAEEDSDTDLDEGNIENKDEYEPKNKEELMKMLGIEQPNLSGSKDDALYSGSEEGEVVSDEEDLAEKKKIKDIIETVKQETLTETLPTVDSDIMPDQLHTVKEKKRRKIDQHPESDGELSSDGEVSSDGELSDDSVDEFGRLKKFRQERVSDDDRKYNYSSGSDSSDTDLESQQRWGPTGSQEEDIEDKESHYTRSRSVTPSPEKEILPTIAKEDVLDETVNKEQTKEELEEKERLRLEVANLESSIEPDIAKRREQLQMKKAAESDSSGTDVSDDETTTEQKQGDQEDDATDSDILKKQLLERLKQKELEEKKVTALEPDVSATIKEEDTPNVDKAEVEDGDDEKEEQKGLDMFAESGDEAGKDNEKPAEEDTEEKMETEVEPGTEKSVETEIVEAESKPDTLKSLHDLKNRMGEMTREELEEALKKLPTDNAFSLDDGRTTPIHLRGIEVPIKSLTEFVHDKRILYKQVFRTINKKEFKRMLPKYLKKYDCKTVRNWCLDELEIISKKRIRSLVLRQLLASSSSESDDDEDEKQKEKAPTKSEEPIVKEEEKPTDKKEKEKKKKTKKSKSKKKTQGEAPVKEDEIKKEIKDEATEEQTEVNTEGEPQIEEKSDMYEGDIEVKVEIDTEKEEKLEETVSKEDANQEENSEAKQNEEETVEQPKELVEQLESKEKENENPGGKVEEKPEEKAESNKEESGDESGESSEGEENTKKASPKEPDAAVTPQAMSTSKDKQGSSESESGSGEEESSDEENDNDNSSNESSSDEDDNENEKNKQRESSAKRRSRSKGKASSKKIEEDTSDDEEEEESDEENESDVDTKRLKMKREREKERQRRRRKNTKRSSSESDDDDSSSQESESKKKRQHKGEEKRRHERREHGRDSKERRSVDKRHHGNEKLTREEYMLRKQMYLKEREARKREYMRQKKRAFMDQQRQQQQPHRNHRGGEVQSDVKTRDRKHQRRREKESDSSNEESGESGDEQDDENEERKQRVQKYYREKERRRQQEKEEEDSKNVKQNPRRGKNDDDTSEGSDSSDDDDSSSSSSSSDDDDDEEENNEDEETYRNQMRSARPGGHQPHHRGNSEQDRRDFENYLKQKRMRLEQDKKIDLRSKIQGGGAERGDRPPMGGRAAPHINQQTAQKGKPAGYDERRRQRELERRKMLEPETRRSDRNEPAANAYESKRVVVRSKMYADKIQNSNKKPYDYNNRGRILSRSPSDNETNSHKRLSRESSETRKTKRRLDNRRSLSNDTMKRKRRNSSDERASNDKAGAKNLKELEFRARALESLISKKAEQNSRGSREQHRRSKR